MGFRIRKMLGYGLTDVKTRNGFIVDPRINLQSSLLDEKNMKDRYGTQTDALEDCKKWMNENPDATGLALDDDYTFDSFNEKHPSYGLTDLVHHDTELGKKSVLCYVPIGYYDEWFRRDDSIDYEESGRYRYPMAPRVTLSRAGFFPHEGTYMDVRTGERLKPSVSSWVKDLRLIKEDISDDFTDELLTKGGFKNWGEAVKFVAPAIPEDVRRFLTWGELFTDPACINHLRPMIYSYWA